MTAFIDTSSLIKRYIAEDNSSKLGRILGGVTALIISPITTIELFSGVSRRLADHSLSRHQYAMIEKEIYKNQNDLLIVQWSIDLEQLSIDMTKKYTLRTLDSIQLASGILSSSEKFITSDRKLYQAAKKEINEAVLL